MRSHLFIGIVAVLFLPVALIHSRSETSERARNGHMRRSKHQHDERNHHSHHEHKHHLEEAPLPESPKPPKEFNAAEADRRIYTGFKADPLPLNTNLPVEFDWCNTSEGRSFCTSSWNQHIPNYCGSCYIHGALHAANDRIKLLMDGKNDVMLARQVILNCGSSKHLGAGCDGGEVFDVFEFMHRYGLPDESCQNYIAQSNHKDPTRCDATDVCMNCMPSIRNESRMECWEVISPIRYYVSEYGLVSGEQAIMNEIYERGPITCAFASVDDFDYNYRGGVYIDHTNATDSNHDVEVVGWGIDQATGLKYWKARNSWGTYWGENSFFKIVRGINNMRFEEECVFALFDVHDLEEVLSGELRGSMFGVVKEPQSNVTEVGYKDEQQEGSEERVWRAHHKHHKHEHEEKHEKRAPSRVESKSVWPHETLRSPENDPRGSSAPMPVAHHGKPRRSHSGSNAGTIPVDPKHTNRYWKEKYGSEDEDDSDPGSANMNMNLNLNLNFKPGEPIGVTAETEITKKQRKPRSSTTPSRRISGDELDRELSELP